MKRPSHKDLKAKALAIPEVKEEYDRLQTGRCTYCGRAIIIADPISIECCHTCAHYALFKQ